MTYRQTTVMYVSVDKIPSKTRGFIFSGATLNETARGENGLGNRFEKERQRCVTNVFK